MKYSYAYYDKPYQLCMISTQETERNTIVCQHSITPVITKFRVEYSDPDQMNRNVRLTGVSIFVAGEFNLGGLHRLTVSVKFRYQSFVAIWLLRLNHLCKKLAFPKLNMNNFYSNWIGFQINICNLIIGLRWKFKSLRVNFQVLASASPLGIFISWPCIYLFIGRCTLGEYYTSTHPVSGIW